MLPKLVRNKIPQIIVENGKNCSYRLAEEFLENPCLEEAADIYEVFLAMLNNWNLDFSSVVNHAYYKREERGSFNSRVILEDLGD